MHSPLRLFLPPFGEVEESAQVFSFTDLTFLFALSGSFFLRFSSLYDIGSSWPYIGPGKIVLSDV